MAPCLSRMPDLCLEAIFNHLPLMDLLDTVGLVCKNWYKSRATALRQRRRLVMLSEDQLDLIYSYFIYSRHETYLIPHVRRDDGSSWCTLESRDQIKFDAILLSNDFPCTVPFTTSMMLHLSHITQLVLIQRCPYSTLPQVVRILEHFSAQLVDLKLKIYAYPDDALECRVKTRWGYSRYGTCANDHNMTNLIACLGRLSALEHLRLHLTTYKPVSNADLHLPLLLKLFHLKTFAFNFENVLYGSELRTITDVLPSLSKLTTTAESRFEMFRCEDLTTLLQMDTEIVTSFSALNVRFFNEDFSPVSLFCARFSSLTKLTFVTATLRLATLSRCLAQLRHLVQFELRFGLDDYEVEDENQEFAQVHSVRLLIINFESESHNVSEKFSNIQLIFPNVQVLCLEQKIIRCPECGIDSIDSPYNDKPHDIEQSEPELASRLYECKRLTRQVFRLCTSLHTIAVESPGGDDEILITINEL